MHQVDPNRQKAVALRIVAYSVTLLLTAITTVVLLYAALGYRFDRSGHVTKNGLLLVDNRPEAGSVYVNNQLKDGATPSRFVLAAGAYNLALKRAGYHDWSKQVQLSASGVREVTYPLLIPTKLSSKKLVDLERPELVTQSQDRKLLLTHVANASQMQLLELDPKEPKQTTLALPSSIKRENGQYGTFTLVEWALNNKQVLLLQTLPSGATQLLSLDITKPEEAINITSLYSNEVPSDIHYVGGNSNQIYGLRNGVLSRYSLKENDVTPLLQDIRSYQPYGDDTILFDRLLGQTAEIGIWQNKTSTIIQRGTAADAPALLRYANYEDNYYFVVAVPSKNSLTLYRDPLKKPILAKQLPLKTLQFENPQKLDFSDSSQFILAQNGKNFITYDLNDLLAYQVTLPFDLAEGTKLNWIDSAHIEAQASDGTGYLVEYDGQNQHSLVASRVGVRLLFANDYKHVYQLTDDQNAQSKLSVTSLVANKD